jgi:2-phosphoglycerate kinase
MAKTTATAANLSTEPERRAELRSLANDYLTGAETLLTPPRPRLIAIGGLSGSGKSTLALGLAPSLGAAPVPL